LPNLAPDGVTITFADGHMRQLPRLTSGPFRYHNYADAYLVAAQQHTQVPPKQAVISASALSLLYPSDGIAGYSRDAFIDDLIREAETDIRRCLARGAHVVQIDFTEGRLSVKLDPTRQLLKHFIFREDSGAGSRDGTGCPGARDLTRCRLTNTSPRYERLPQRVRDSGTSPGAESRRAQTTPPRAVRALVQCKALAAR
jgi:hypothetical protein